MPQSVGPKGAEANRNHGPDGYALNQWDGLVRFLDDGSIELDTNSVERVPCSPLPSTERTPHFAGHDEGPQSWACIASLIEICKLNNVDPQADFADALTRLVDLWPTARIDELMPWI